MNKEIANSLYKYLRDNYGNEDVAQLETFVRSLVVRDGKFISNAGSILNSIMCDIDKEDSNWNRENIFFQELPRIVTKIQDEYFSDLKTRVHFEDVTFAISRKDVERAIEFAGQGVSMNDLKVLILLHNAHLPKYINDILSSHYSHDKGLSPDKWISFLLQYSNMAKRYGDNTLVVDPSNEPFMKNWAKEYKSTSRPVTSKHKSTFKDIIQYKDKDKLLERLHFLIDGKSGANVGAVLLYAWYNKHYLTRRPTQGEFTSEFELKGTWQSISNYMNDGDPKALQKANQIVIFDEN